MNSSNIQIWYSVPENINLSSESSQNKFQVKISDNTPELPAELEQKVADSLTNASKNGKNVTNNPILFLKEPVVEDNGTITMNTDVRGFNYTYAFNRDKNLYHLVDELNKNKLLSISTHVHLLTKDNKLLFGTKKNQFNQISGFSGFPNVDEDSDIVNGERVLDVYKTIVNRLRPEIGYLVDSIDSIIPLGITYVNTLGLRGTDNDFLVKIDEMSYKAKKRFEENSQFKKELHSVDFEPKKVNEFLLWANSNGRVMSRYAMGCVYQEVMNQFGKKEGKKTFEIIQQTGATIAKNNQTKYFHRN